jgi:type I restriction enzyme, S subunit
MSKAWQSVQLGEVIAPIQRTEVPLAGTTYRQIGVKLWGEGAYERETMDGSQTKYGQLFRTEADDIIVNKIWARNGSVAVVAEPLAGCYGSGEFPMFTPNRERLHPRWMHWLTKTRGFWSQCDEKSQGTSGKNRIRPERFLAIEVPLPPLAEQRRVVARIEELAGQIAEASGLREQASKAATVLPLSTLGTYFRRLVEQFGKVRLQDLLTDAGYGSSEKCVAERMDEATPVLRIPNVASERVSLNDLKFARLGVRDRERLMLFEGDVLVVRTNGSLDLVGRSAVVPRLDEDFAFASYMIRLRFDTERVTPEFAQRMLQHLRVAGALVDFARTTAGQYNVSLGRLRSAEIPLPPLAEQLCIVQRLQLLQAKVDSLRHVQAQSAIELDALLPAILDRAFKGELV